MAKHFKQKTSFWIGHRFEEYLRLSPPTHKNDKCETLGAEWHFLKSGRGIELTKTSGLQNLIKLCNNPSTVISNPSGRITISAMCLESYPCKHDVKTKKLSEGRNLMGGVEIYRWFESRNAPIQHFVKYENGYPKMSSLTLQRFKALRKQHELKQQMNKKNGNAQKNI